MLTPQQLARLKRADPSPNRLGVLLDLTGRSQEWLAERVPGLSQSRVSSIVQGECPRLTLTRARDIATVFRVHIDILFPPVRRKA